MKYQSRKKLYYVSSQVTSVFLAMSLLTEKLKNLLVKFLQILKFILTILNHLSTSTFCRNAKPHGTVQFLTNLHAIEPNIIKKRYIPRLSRKEDVVLIRLRIGHTRLTHSSVKNNQYV